MIIITLSNYRYYNYTLSIDGIPEYYGDVDEEDYLTDVIGRKAEDFLSNLMDGKELDEANPFLMVLAFHAPHDPATPALKYADYFTEEIAPRTPAFNYVDDIYNQKHWLLRHGMLPLDQSVINQIDLELQNRWRTLLSVDDVVDNVMTKLDELGVLNDTFVLFTSDHGFHLGQFAMPLGKFQPYETGESIMFNWFILIENCLYSMDHYRIIINMQNPCFRYSCSPFGARSWNQT